MSAEPLKVVTVSLETLDTLLSSKIEPIYDIVEKGKPIMTYAELKEMLGISRTLIDRYVANGQLVSVEVGNRTLFMLNDVLAFINTMRVIDPELLRKKQK